MSLRLLRRPDPMDFQRMILEILARGHGLSDIALALNLPRSTVQDWREGEKTPGYENGRALCILYEQIFQSTPPQKPFELLMAST